MNTHMYQHPLTADHLRVVQDKLGYVVSGPQGAGILACGDEGELQQASVATSYDQWVVLTTRTRQDDRLARHRRAHQRLRGEASFTSRGRLPVNIEHFIYRRRTTEASRRYQ